MTDTPSGDLEHTPKFGDSFEPKLGNRMDPKNRAKEMPEYVIAVVKGAREALKRDAKEFGYGEIPSSVNSIETFFEAAKQRVTEGWNRSVRPEFDKKMAKWAEELQDKEGVDENIIALLKDGDAFESKLAISQFGVLESIRAFAPEVWRELVLTSSDRQLAEVVVAQRWFRDLSKDKQKALVEQMGLQNPKEFDIMLDIAGFMGKYIDHAYVKQIELADAPGGSKETPLHGQSEGVQYLYDIPTHSDTNEVSLHPYIEVFTFEFERIGQSLSILSKRVADLLENNELSSAYEQLPVYLEKMAQVYTSTTHDPESIYEEWQQLMRMSRELALADCPIVLLPQGSPAVAGDANKVDIEVRLGFRTKETRELEKKINGFRILTDTYLQEASGDFEKIHKTPPVLVNHQPFAFGPNTFWEARGEAGKEQIVAHTNAVIDVAVTKAKPAFEKVFLDKITEKEFISATLLDNSLHELGHILAPSDDVEVRKRTGVNMIVEELKADCGAMKLIHMALEAGNPPVDARTQFVAKLGDICDYLQNKSPVPGTSGERYYYDGVAVIYRLFEKNIILEKNGSYQISDARQGIAELATLADEVLDFYRRGTPDALAIFVNNIRQQEKDPRVQAFIKKLKV